MLMLSLATIKWQPGVLVARASLVSLWLFAGIHKVISPAYYQFFVPWLLGPEWETASGVAIAAGLAVGEIALGIGCLFPATRMLVAVGCLKRWITDERCLTPAWEVSRCKGSKVHAGKTQDLSPV